MQEFCETRHETIARKLYPSLLGVGNYLDYAVLHGLFDDFKYDVLKVGQLLTQRIGKGSALVYTNPEGGQKGGREKGIVPVVKGEGSLDQGVTMRRRLGEFSTGFLLTT